MTYFPDLGSIDYLQVAGDSCLRAIGWLDGAHPYEQGEVPREFVRKLTALLHRPWEPIVSCGFHECELCQYPAVISSFEMDGEMAQMGCSNVFVPSDEGVLFVAPSLILHYIAAHWYRPPGVFIDAVMACPAMNSMDYKKALLRAGARELISSLSR